MSALGHQRAFRSAIAMSALPLKADIYCDLFGAKIEAAIWLSQARIYGSLEQKAPQVFTA
jgi:hypothetical protein